ncbi:MAG TPA: polyketide antibiotic transporter, partial [Dermatophilaceae bacterium]|nr:polyketide antibiotic transporter [Dermatophilaceae bacterium]
MSALAGLGPLLRLAWRRDRVLVPISVLAITGSAVSGAQATLALYPTSASMGEAVRAVVTNPAALALYGPVADPTSPDAFAVYKMGTLGGVFLVLLGYALVRRHTRSEEDLGRLELLGAGVVGRRAPLAAAVILATAAVLVTCLLTLAGYVSIGMGVAGSAASVAGWAAAALAFVGVTAVTAQVSSTARGCAGLTLGALGASYLLRAVVDGNPSSPQWLIWLSPLGWAEQAQAFAANRTWVVLLGVAALVAGLLAAVVVLENRDLGAGLIATRTGAADASPSLSSALGLAWRQGRAGPRTASAQRCDPGAAA